MRYNLTSLLLATAAALVTAVAAQSDPGTVPLDPNATCPQETADSITTCLARVEQDEAQLPGGPCSDGQWDCICNKQQGLIACWAPCYGAQPAEQVQYNNNNCNGQHGVTNAAAANGNGAQYRGSALTTTAAASGSTGATPTGSVASSTSSASANASTSATSAASSSSGSQTQSRSSSTGTGSSASASSTQRNGAPSMPRGIAAAGVVGGALAAALALV